MRLFVLFLWFNLLALSPASSSSVILECKTENTLRVSGCGWSLTCTDKYGQKFTEPWFAPDTYSEEESSQSLFKIFATRQKIVLIRPNGQEVEWTGDEVYALSETFIGTKSEAGGWDILHLSGGEKKFYYSRSGAFSPQIYTGSRR